jgi:hypothetical protein
VAFTPDSHWQTLAEGKLRVWDGTFYFGEYDNDVNSNPTAPAINSFMGYFDSQSDVSNSVILSIYDFGEETGVGPQVPPSVRCAIM